MKRFLLLLAPLAVIALVLGGPLTPVSQAQVLLPASINFRNQTTIPIIVQGVSIVGGTPRKGQPVFIPPGKNAWDTNVPPGPRHYKVYDGTQPSRVLNPHIAVPVFNRDLFLVVRPAPGGTVEVVPGFPGK